MTSQSAGKESQHGIDSDHVHAEHGTPSEVSWDGGAGRQPYSNQGPQEGPEPNHDNEFAEGDRGELSGRNLEQLEQVRKMP